MGNTRAKVNGASTVVCVSIGPKSGSWRRAVNAVTQYIALGAAVKARVESSRVILSLAGRGMYEPKNSVGRRTLARWFVVGMCAYCGTSARSYTNTTRVSAVVRSVKESGRYIPVKPRDMVVVDNREGVQS